LITHDFTVRNDLAGVTDTVAIYDLVSSTVVAANSTVFVINILSRNWIQETFVNLAVAVVVKPVTYLSWQFAWSPALFLTALDTKTGVGWGGWI